MINDSRDERPDDIDGQGAAEAEGAQGSEDVSGAEDAGDSSDQETLLLSLEDARAKADEHWNELLRTRAELVNLQRRAERDVSNAHKYGIERFATELLPVIDSLELGLNAAGEAGATDNDKLREGMELTLKLLLSATAKFGLTPVDPAGERFNPELHQAMSMQPADGVEPNTVLTVYQKGWLLHDRLIRPAMVVVAGPAGGGSAEPAGGDGDAGRAGGNIDEMA